MSVRPLFSLSFMTYPSCDHSPVAVTNEASVARLILIISISSLTNFNPVVRVDFKNSTAFYNNV